jgi:hypothetical protein
LPQTGSPLWRKRAIQDVGGWNEQQTVCQEHELYLRLIAAGKHFSYEDVAGAVYRHWSEDTICRRDKRSTYSERLRIIEQSEQHLKSRGELSCSRQNAINQSRFICARILWEQDRELAKSTIRQVYEIDLDFRPDSDSAPFAYRMVFRFLGLSNAERVAALTRPLRRLKGDNLTSEQGQFSAYSI